ncbi:hypothetical protein CAEBREN_15564 [Caenorhabditis brenneri]|uniref:Uncharacterized protein n=1 Tax=Caenorhabditis brenneri TaxID=135651 RepID=G0P7C9_CAEBE|nr:hypothetical protein CAEBREN_15564 [Caenorhabditis brenneri]
MIIINLTIFLFILIPDVLAMHKLCSTLPQNIG